VADIMLGVKTLLNPFFYLDEETIEKFGIEKRFLEPVFRQDDAQLAKYVQKASSCKLKVFKCTTHVSGLSGTGAAAYIQWGTKQKTSAGIPWPETAASKSHAPNPWYFTITLPPPTRIIVGKLINDTFAPMLLDKPVLVDQSYQLIKAKEDTNEDVVIAFLCSTWFAALLETFGRTAMGEGALQVPTETLRGLPIPDLRELSDKQSENLAAKSAAVLKQPRLPIAKAIATPEQQELDAALLEILGYKSSRATELYADVLRMRKVRRVLATGRSSIKRERFEADLDAVAKDFAAQLEPVIGGKRFPRDFLPAGAKTVVVQLGSAPIDVESSSFLGIRDTKVLAGGKVIYEAELPASVGEVLLRAIQAGQRDIELPKSDGDAASALDDLETLLSQLRMKLGELNATAGAKSQASLRSLTEGYLNFPVDDLGEPLPAVFQESFS
jgi:hypothetical protein